MSALQKPQFINSDGNLNAHMPDGVRLEEAPDIPSPSREAPAVTLVPSRNFFGMSGTISCRTLSDLCSDEVTSFDEDVTFCRGLIPQFLSSPSGLAPAGQAQFLNSSVPPDAYFCGTHQRSELFNGKIPNQSPSQERSRWNHRTDWLFRTHCDRLSVFLQKIFGTDRGRS